VRELQTTNTDSGLSEHFIRDVLSRLSTGAAEFVSYRFSTRELPERMRIPLWRETFGRGMVHVDIEPLSSVPFQADATLQAIRGLRTLALKSSSMRFKRSARAVRARLWPRAPGTRDGPVRGYLPSRISRFNFHANRYTKAVRDVAQCRRPTSSNSEPRPTVSAYWRKPDIWLDPKVSEGPKADVGTAGKPELQSSIHWRMNWRRYRIRKGDGRRGKWTVSGHVECRYGT
jgi:hypothetical protein